MKRQKSRLQYRNKFVYYVREESSVHKSFYKHKGSTLTYSEFFDLVEELNNVTYYNYDRGMNKNYIAEIGQTDFSERYKLYL